MATQLHRSIASMKLDEIDIVDQVMATHDPNEDNFVNASDVLNFAENILNSNEDSKEIKKSMLELEEPIQKEFSRQIKQLSFEVIFKSVSDDDCHSVAIYILSMLSAYPWEAKAVIMLATFALIRGNFITISQHCNKKRLANNLALMKPNLFATPSGQIIYEIADDSIVTSVVDLVKCMVEIDQSSSSSISQSVILACYWIAMSVHTCARRIFGVGSQNKEMEESTIIAKIKSILSTCRPLLELKRTEKSYEALLDAFSNSSNISEVLKLIFNIKDSNNKEKFLYAVWNTSLDGVELWKNMKNMRVLFIVIPGGINVSEVNFLTRQLWNMHVSSAFIIWIPIVDDIELWTVQNMQSRLTQVMHCGRIVLDAEKRVTPQFVRFVREKCSPTFQTDGEPIIISLDSRGRLVHMNALHMILTWRKDLERDMVKVGDTINIISLLKKELAEMTVGVESAISGIEKKRSDLVIDLHKRINDWRNDIDALIKYSDASYNYTSKMEKELWDKQTWSLKLLVHMDEYSVFTTITNWIEENNDIFLYGGDDTKCVEEFITKIKEVKSKVQANIKLAYIGKSKKVRSLVENLSDITLDDSYYYWCFWTRLRSAFISRINYLNEVGHDEMEDKIVQGLEKLLAYEAKGTTVGCWALLSKGNEVLMCDLGDKMLEVIDGFEKWKDNMDNSGFSPSFKDYYDTLASTSSKHDHPWCALEYPTTMDPNRIPEDVKCPQCSCNMHKFITFTCCHDADIWDCENWSYSLRRI